MVGLLVRWFCFCEPRQALPGCFGRLLLGVALPLAGLACPTREALLLSIFWLDVGEVGAAATTTMSRLCVDLGGWGMEVVVGNHGHLWGPRAPCWFGRGDVTLHKKQRSMGQHGRDHTGNFTQVRVAVRRKTLLMLCWIYGGLW